MANEAIYALKYPIFINYNKTRYNHLTLIIQLVTQVVVVVVAVVYRHLIAQYRLRSVGFTTSFKNISSVYLRVRKRSREPARHNQAPRYRLREIRRKPAGTADGDPRLTHSPYCCCCCGLGRVAAEAQASNFLFSCLFFVFIFFMDRTTVL